MNKNKIEIAANLAVAGIFIFYILSLNPTSYIYLRNNFRAVRWWIWNTTTPEWLKEAVLVRRGYL